MTWFFFEPTNRELRTIPTAFGATRISDLTWAKNLLGRHIKPGDVLGSVTFVGAAPQDLIAPVGCDGIVVRTFDPHIAAQAMRPSQWLLYLA